MMKVIAAKQQCFGTGGRTANDKAKIIEMVEQNANVTLVVQLHFVNPSYYQVSNSECDVEAEVGDTTTTLNQLAIPCDFPFGLPDDTVAVVL